MGLALAGAIGGLGQGLQQGLINMQSGIIQSGLQDERFKRDAQAADTDRTFQMSKQAKQQEFEKDLKEKDYAEARARNQEKMGTDILLHGMKANEDAALVDKKIAAEHADAQTRAGASVVTEGIKAQVDREKNEVTRQHYQDWEKVSSAIKSGKVGGHDLPESVKIAAKGLMDSADKFDAAAAKSLDEKESAYFSEQGQTFRDKALAMLGVELPRPKSDVVPPGYKDPAKKKTTAQPGLPTVGGTGNGLINTPHKPANVVRDRNETIAALEAALLEAKKSGNNQAIEHIQGQLRALTQP